MPEIIDDFDPQTGNRKKKNRIHPLFIHGVFLLLLLVIIFVFFFSDFSFFSDEEERPKLNVVGDQENFSIPYSGDLKVGTSDFSLKVSSGKFDGRSEDFIISDFEGLIVQSGKGILFEGTAQNISFERNELNLDGSSFLLNSSRRTSFSVNLENLDLYFEEGVLKFADELTYNFKNAQFNIVNTNATINYDGKFSFKGFVESFVMKNDKNLEISYFENQSITSD